MPNTTQGQHVEALSSHNIFPKTGVKRFIRQYSAVCISSPLTNTLPMAGRQQHKGLSLVGGFHNLKRHCGHFSTTHCLKIQKASNARPLGAWERSWARTLHPHPASYFPLGILHSTVSDMHSQDKHIISHYCLLMTWPMVFPRISTSLGSHQQMPRPCSVPLPHSPPQHATGSFPTSRLTPAFADPSVNDSTMKKHTDDITYMVSSALSTLSIGDVSIALNGNAIDFMLWENNPNADEHTTLTDYIDCVGEFRFRVLFLEGVSLCGFDSLYIITKRSFLGLL